MEGNEQRVKREVRRVLRKMKIGSMRGTLRVDWPLQHSRSRFVGGRAETHSVVYFVTKQSNVTRIPSLYSAAVNHVGRAITMRSTTHYTCLQLNCRLLCLLCTLLNVFVPPTCIHSLIDRSCLPHHKLTRYVRIALSMHRRINVTNNEASYERCTRSSHRQDRRPL